jgi:hypothetical protein
MTILKLKHQKSVISSKITLHFLLLSPCVTVIKHLIFVTDDAAK